MVLEVIRQVPLLRAEFQLPRLSFLSDLRRGAASRWDLPHISSLFVDHRSPDFFHGTREEWLSITFLSDFGYIDPFRR